MFANKHERSDIIHEVDIISETTSFAEGKHHSKKPNGEALGFFVAHRTGFEPATYRIGICCSIQLSYRSLAAFAAKIWS